MWLGLHCCQQLPSAWIWPLADLLVKGGCLGGVWWALGKRVQRVSRWGKGAGE